MSYTAWKIDFEKKCFVTEEDAHLNFIAPTGNIIKCAMDVTSIKKKLLAYNELCKLLSADIMIPGKKEPKKFPCIKKWLNEPGKRTYSKIDQIPPPRVCPDNIYNIWKGFSRDNNNVEVCPKLREFAVKTFKRFMAHIGKDTPTLEEFLILYIADIIQNPGHKPGILLILTGAQGTYKGTFYKLILKLIDRYALKVTSSDVVFGRFNNILIGNLFVNFDEALSKNMIDNNSKLKSLTTEDTIVLEAKNQQAFEINNFSRIIICTNERIGAKAEMSDRRNVYIETEPMSLEMQREINEVMDSEECMQAIFEHLRDEVEIPYKTSFEWQSNRPLTERHTEIVEQFKDPIYLFLMETMEDQMSTIARYGSIDIYTRYTNCTRFAKNNIVFVQDVCKMDGISKKRKTVSGKKITFIYINKDKLYKYLIDNKFVVDEDTDSSDDEDTELIEEIDDLDT